MCSGAAAGTGSARALGPAPAGRRGVAVGPAHHPVDRLEQLVLQDGLEQVGVDPQLPGACRVARAVPRGEQDDPDGGQRRSLADPGGHGQAVGVGHAGVEQHQRVGLAETGGVPEGAHGRQAVADRGRVHLPAAEPLLQDVAVGGVVVDHEDPEAPEQDRRPGGEAARWGAAGARTAP